jgi:hypothetical protein
MEKAKLTPEEIRNGLRPIIEDIFERLLPHAATRIGLSDRELRRRLSIHLRPVRFSDDINAYVNAGASVITINEALMLFYHKIVKLFVATINVGNIKTGIMQNTRISSKKVIGVCRELMQAYLEDRILMQPGIMTEELTRGQIIVCSRLVRSCETFAVAHELGHVVIAKMKGEIVEYATAKRAVREFLEEIPDLAETQKLELVKPWSNELCADLIGLQLSCSQPETEPYNHWRNYKQWLSSGAQINRLSELMLQEYQDKLTLGHKITLVSTHPHDYLRVDTIRKSSEEFNSSGHYDFGKIFGQFAMGVLDDIFVKTENGDYKLRNH